MRLGIVKGNETGNFTPSKIASVVKKSTSTLANRLSLSWQNTKNYGAIALAIVACIANLFTNHIFIAIGFAIFGVKMGYDAYCARKIPQLADLKQRVEELTHIKDDLKIEVNSLHSLNKKFKSRLGKFKQENKTYQIQNQQLQISLEHLHQGNKIFREENQKLSLSNLKLEKQVQDLSQFAQKTKEGVKQQKTDHEAVILQQKQQIQILQEQIQNLHNTYNEISIKKELLQAQIQTLQNSIKYHENQVELFAKKTLSLAKLVTALGITEHSFTHIYGDFDQHMQQLGAQVEDMQKILEYITNNKAQRNLFEACNRMEQKLNQASIQFGYLLAQKEHLLQEIQKLTSQLHQHDEKMHQNSVKLEQFIHALAGVTPNALKLVQELKDMKDQWNPDLLKGSLLEVENRLQTIALPPSA